MSRRSALCLAAALLAAHASASEVGVLFDRQFGVAQSATLRPGTSRWDAVKPSGFAVRGSLELVDIPFFELGLTAAYHGKSESDLVAEGKTLGKYGHEYAALGVQVEWRLLVNLYAGAELRQERLSTTLDGLWETTTYARPWIRGGIGFSIPAPIVQPFVRLEVAYAARKASGAENWDAFRKAMAPEYQVGVYAGIRF